MAPRSLHRWKSFWFGLVVLVFFGWSWVRSMNHTDMVSWVPRRGLSEGDIYITAGEIGFSWNTERASIGIPFPAGWNFSSKPGVVGEAWFPQAAYFSSVDDLTVLFLAHWFLILLFLIPWTAFLLWRGRRLKRLAATATVPQP